MLIFVFGDIRDTDKILKIVNDFNFDSVVILAAIVGDAACAVNVSLTEEVNYLAVRRLCESLPENVYTIFASTCSVYGENDDMVDENSVTKPLSAYAATKLKAEKYVLDRGGTIFRLGTVFGLGDNFSRIRADLVVNTLTIKAFCQKEITVNGGEQWRPIIAAKDVAKYIVEACERKEDVAGLYNLAYENVKISDLADVVLSKFPDIKVNKVEQLFEDKRNYKVSSQKSKLKFKHTPSVKVIDEIGALRVLLETGRIKDATNINYHNGLFLAHKRI